MTRTTRLAALAVGTALLAAACSSPSSSDSKPQPAPPAAASSSSVAQPAADAATAFKKIAAAVPSATGSTPVTADNDPNHLLGRPGQYTSKITFGDSRIKPADTQGLEPGDVQLGGAIETFASNTEAQARATYIQAATKALPTLTEYDYVHGIHLIRVSHYLTPTQAEEYRTAAGKLP
nr:hypothetical protein OG513_05435 [Streptomyces sp. NBC_00998]